MQTRTNQDAKGIDVSHWQGNIDWSQVHKSGITFAYIKATEGTGYKDPSYGTNFTKAKAVGILRGAYHFARPAASSGETQADFFLSTLHEYPTIGDLPPALDLEDAGGKSQSELTAWVEAFASRIHAKAGLNPVIYVSPGFAGSFLNSKVSDLLLWVADWGVASPNNFNGWTHWTFWQYTNTGSVAGISGNVDLDVYAGTVANIQQRFRGTSGKPSGTGTPIGSLPMLQQGDSGSYVKDVEVLLYRVGQHPNGVTGVFDANTRISVESFQSDVKITVDGIVGPVTWSHLLKHPTASRPTLQLWSAGQEVTDLQYLLGFHGENPGPVDGIFANSTEAAVKAFQTSNHLPVTGVVDAATWNKLTASLPQPIA